MPRPSNRAARRRQILEALERVMARSGVGSATVEAVAQEAELAPGLVHHHFRNKEELFAELARDLQGRFREASQGRDLEGRLDAALALRGEAGMRTARAWVGLFAQALRSPALLEQLRRGVRSELRRVERSLEEAGLDRGEAERGAAGLVAFVLGALVFGALLPRTRVGFAAPTARRLARALLNQRAETPSATTENGPR
ncbi:MAG: TetR family transcriptional regulator [Myxococcota bacterium]